MALERIESFATDLARASRCFGTSHALRLWVLARLRAVVTFDTAIYVPLSHPFGGPSALDRERAEYLRYYGLFLERPAYYAPDLDKGKAAAEASGGAYVDTDVYSARERDRLPFFADIIRPQDITSQVIVSVDFHARSRASIHLCRHGRTTPFQREEGALVSRLVPALALAQAAFEAAGDGERAAHGPLDRLSDRERAIARLVTRGFANRDIATLLGTSPNTVRNQLSAVFRKLNVRSRAHLASVVTARDP